MTSKTAFISLCASLLLSLCAGCTPAHQRYYGCHVPCKYCAPAPLPYTEYHACPCHSCAAAKYLSNPPPADEPVTMPAG